MLSRFLTRWTFAALGVLLPAAAGFAQNAAAPPSYQPCADSYDYLPARPGAMGPNYSISKIMNLLKNAQSNQVVLSAHRGFWPNAPENSVRAVWAATDLGTEVVEIDVGETADGVPVLSHDQDIGRTTTAQYNPDLRDSSGNPIPARNQFDLSHINYAQFASLNVRDRHGCPSETKTITLADFLRAMVDSGVVRWTNVQTASPSARYIQPGTATGTVIVIDVKASLGDGGARMYGILRDSIRVWKSVYNLTTAQAAAYQNLPGLPPERGADFSANPLIPLTYSPYGVLSQAVVFKVRSEALPATMSAFVQDVTNDSLNAFLNFTPGYGWTDSSVGDYPAGDYTVPPIIPVLYPDDTLSNGDPHPTTLSDVAAGADTKFSSYFNASDGVSFIDPRSIVYRPFHFESNEFYPGDVEAGYRQFLVQNNRPITAYAPENYFVEGEPSAGLCCKVPISSYVSGATSLEVPLPGCFSSRADAPCLDLRGNWDMYQTTGLGVFTLERIDDAINYYNNLGLRNASAYAP